MPKFFTSPGVHMLTYDDVILVPQFSSVATRNQISLRHGSLDLPLPFISANMDSVTEADMAIAMYENGGLGIIHRFLDRSKLVSILDKVVSRDAKCAVTVGIKDTSAIIGPALEYGVKVFCVDVAHGHSKHMLSTIEYVKRTISAIKGDGYKVIAGNVATQDGVRDLANAGADIIKVGIGPGSHCTTRIVTGHGFPQLDALIYCCDKAQELGVEIIADGGIKNSGDIAKSFAAGADYVMLGKLLAGCTESAGELISIEGKLWKNYRGMASREAQTSRGKKRAAEGVASFVPFTEPVEETLKELSDGVKSAFSYTGATDFTMFRERAMFAKVTNNSHLEGQAHGVLLR